MKIQTRTSQLQLMFMVSYYSMIRVKINKEDKIPLHILKNTTEVSSSLMQMFTARGLFSGLPSEDPHAHIAKVRAVCKSCVERPDLNMDVIGLRVFPLSLMGEAAI